MSVPNSFSGPVGRKDVDTGTDDAIAIMLAALHQSLDLIGLTTVNGNVTVETATIARCGWSTSSAPPPLSMMAAPGPSFGETSPFRAPSAISPRMRTAVRCLFPKPRLRSGRDTRLAGITAPIDGVTVQLADLSIVQDDAAQARSLGMTGKLCIHPKQVAEVKRAFARPRWKSVGHNACWHRGKARRQLMAPWWTSRSASGPEPFWPKCEVHPDFVP